MILRTSFFEDMKQHGGAMLSCDPIKYFLLAFMLSNTLAASHAQSENTTQPEVTIPQGTLRGTTRQTIHDRNVFAFLGIPYAQPPTGNLRFANPVSATGWSGIRSADVDANRCLQSSSGVVIGDEDCLYLNVYTPQLPQSSNASQLPVMVYIHGGGFTGWSSVSTLFGPEYILDEDLLLVTLNYRLGPLGFLSTGDEVASGNWGLKDQALALEWVQNNAEYFNGDPSQVTLFGQSAGAVSVHLLSLSNATIGLFHRFITQSGSALAPWAYRSRSASASLAFEFGELFECSNETTDSLISCLRAVDGSDIIVRDSLFNVMWRPTDEPDIEGALLTDSPTNLFAAGKIRDLPWICGTVRDEGLLFTVALYEDDEAFDNYLEDFNSSLANMLEYTSLSDGGAAWNEAIMSYYFNNDLTVNKSLLLANLTNLAGDFSFFYPAYNALQRQPDLSISPKYFYNFNYRGKYSFTYVDTGGSLAYYGISHSEDVLFLFPASDLFPGINETKSETDFELVDIMRDLWTSFAINSTPSTDDNTMWEPYSITANNYFQIGDEFDTTLETRYSFLKERMEFWVSLTDTTDNDSGSATLIPNLLFVLLLFCSKYLLSV